MTYIIVAAVILLCIFLAKRAANRASAARRKQQETLRDQAIADGEKAARDGRSESNCPHPYAGHDPGTKPIGVLAVIVSEAELADQRYWWLAGYRNAMKRMAKPQQASVEQVRGLPEDLKPYVARLRKVFGTVGSFASPETVQIGEEIYKQHGHAAMVLVCDTIRAQLGAGPARDLEYKWNGVGEWMG